MKKVLFKKFAVAMAEKFGLTLEEMFTVNRDHDVVQARWMLYYLCVERKISIPYIKKCLAEQGYKASASTITYGYKKASQLVATDYDYKQLTTEHLIENVMAD